MPAANKNTQTVATKVEQTVETAVKVELPKLETAAEQVVEKVVTGQETPEQVVDQVKDAVSNAGVEAATETAEDVATGKANEVLDKVLHTGIEAAIDLVEARVPLLGALLHKIEPLIETRVFAVSNVVTSDFIHHAGTYLIELEHEALVGLDKTAINAKLEAKVLEEDGVRLLSNAIHWVEVTGAKVLRHRP